MIDCNYYIAEYSFETRLPKRGTNTYASGLEDKDKGHVKYGPPSSSEPILQISDNIYDKNFNMIPKGYYELNLSDDNNFLLLCERGMIIAKIPVFKIEQDKKKMEEYAKKNKKPNGVFQALKYKCKSKWEKRQRTKKLNNKFIEEDPQPYSDATIEYDIKGDYYIIKYEKEFIRAWGVLKTY